MKYSVPNIKDVDMGCGACAKRRQQLAKAAKAARAGKTARIKKIKQTATKRITKRGLVSMGVKSPRRCPICRTMMRRVSKKGREMLVCANPKCAHVRKL